MPINGWGLTPKGTLARNAAYHLGTGFPSRKPDREVRESGRFWTDSFRRRVPISRFTVRDELPGYPAVVSLPGIRIEVEVILQYCISDFP